jgi:hypothetical protein
LRKRRRGGPSRGCEELLATEPTGVYLRSDSLAGAWGRLADKAKRGLRDLGVVVGDAALSHRREEDLVVTSSVREATGSRSQPVGS